MESEYTETANQFLDCVNKVNVHTLLYKKRKKILSESVVFKMQSYELLL